MAKSAIEQYSYEKAREAVLTTLRNLSRYSPGEYFTISRIGFDTEHMVCAQEEDSRDMERTEIIRKTFSKRNLLKMFHRDNISPQLDIIVVNDQFQGYYAYRLKGRKEK